MRKVSYAPLFKRLIDLNMQKKQLAALSGVSSQSLARMRRGESVGLDIVAKLCDTLDCSIQDIVSIERC